MKTLETLLSAEQLLTDEGRVSFHADSAGLFSVRFVDGEVSGVLRETSHPDVYKMLRSRVATEVVRIHGNALITTCGWAAPLSSANENTAPSQCPDRRRVRLAILLDAQGIASIVRFEDDEEVITDEGSATGNLGDALRDLRERAMK